MNMGVAYAYDLGWQLAAAMQCNTVDVDYSNHTQPSVVP